MTAMDGLEGKKQLGSACDGECKVARRRRAETAFGSAIVVLVGADAVNYKALGQSFEAQRLLIKRVKRHDSKLRRHECRQRGRQRASIGEPVTLHCQCSLGGALSRQACEMVFAMEPPELSCL